jgi:hypothetical protein
MPLKFEAETGEDLLEGPIETTDPLQQLRAVLQAPTPHSQRLYHDIELALQRVQRNRVGPLTDCFQAWVGREVQ